MSFSRKIILLLFVVAVVPTTVSSFVSNRISEQGMKARIDDYQHKDAQLLSQAVHSYLNDAANSVRMSATLIPFG